MSESPQLSGAPHAEALKRLADVAKMVIEPIATVAQTYADMHRLKKLTTTEIECANLKQRALMNAEITAIRHQQNLEAIVDLSRLEIDALGAKKLLPEKAGEVTSDPDWFYKWARYAKESSDADIRALWAKILAGEIVREGRFSLRLLHTVSLLRKSEAQKFQCLANYMCRDGEGRMFFLEISQAKEWLLKRCGLDEKALKSLEQIGLLQRRRDIGGTLFHSKIHYGGKSYALKRLKPSNPIKSGFISVEPRPFTELGEELYELCIIEPDQEYADLLFTKIFRQENSCWEVTAVA